MLFLRILHAFIMNTSVQFRPVASLRLSCPPQSRVKFLANTRLFLSRSGLQDLQIDLAQIGSAFACTGSSQIATDELRRMTRH